MRRHALAALLLLSLLACGDDAEDDDKNAASAEIRQVCRAMCARQDDCDFPDGLTPAECESECEPLQTRVMGRGCALNASEANACSESFSVQVCSEVRRLAIPATCMKTCD